jgi:lipoprotein-anchoring transpeptidase ErfK/SrfK
MSKGLARLVIAALLLPSLASASRAEEGDSPTRSRVDQLIAEMARDGSANVEELADILATDGREKLDHIIVNLATQTLYECNIDGQVLHETHISSGRKGYDTPPGEYKIVNKALKAYSKKYEAWMLYWMGLTSDGGYGMHGLEGSSYERLLGRVASHGCIRLSRSFAKEIYPRVEVGMPVSIISDPELKIQAFQPISREAALSMVLEALSPSDPSDIFY